jgi:hypothetical protein
MRLPLLAALGLVATLGITTFGAPEANALTRRATVRSSARGAAVVSRPFRARGAVVVRRALGARMVVRHPLGTRVVVRNPLGTRSAVMVRPVGALGAVTMRRRIVR